MGMRAAPIPTVTACAETFFLKRFQPSILSATNMWNLGRRGEVVRIFFTGCGKGNKGCSKTGIIDNIAM